MTWSWFAGRNSLLFAAGLCALPQVARGAELKVRGSRGILRVAGEEKHYQLVDPSTPVDTTVNGPGELTLVARAIQPLSATASIATIRLSVDGSELLTLGLPEGRSGHFLGKRELVPGPALTRSLRIGPGTRTLAVSSENGAVAIVLTYEPDGPEIAAAPLVAAPAPPVAATQETPPALLPPARPEPVVPLTVDDSAKPVHPVWPYGTAIGALTCGFGAGVLALIAQNQYNAYKTTPTDANQGIYTDATRNGKLSTARAELVGAGVLGGIAVALLVASTVGFAF